MPLRKLKRCIARKSDRLPGEVFRLILQRVRRPEARGTPTGTFTRAYFTVFWRRLLIFSDQKRVNGPISLCVGSVAAVFPTGSLGNVVTMTSGLVDVLCNRAEGPSTNWWWISPWN